MTGMETSNYPSTRSEAKRIGSTYYFTGNACPYGHVGLRLTSNKGCVACSRERYILWRSKNPEYDKRWREKNRYSCRKSSMRWHLKNSDYRKDYSRQWHKNNPHYQSQYLQENLEKHRENQAARRAIKTKRCPPWADRKAIQEVYDEAHRLTEETGKLHHVDHIMPLKNKFLCGLHVHWNLEPLEAYKNYSKRNSYDPSRASATITPYIKAIERGNIHEH